MAVRGSSAEEVAGLVDGLSGKILPIFEATLPRLEAPPPSLSFLKTPPRPPLDLSGLEFGLVILRGLRTAANLPTGEGERLELSSIGACSSPAGDTAEVSVVATAFDDKGNVEALESNPSNCGTDSASETGGSACFNGKVKYV